MIHAAITHESTKKYCFALATGKFLIRLETARGDMKTVTLYIIDKYLSRHVKSEPVTMPMKRVSYDRYKDYYEAVVDIDMICLRYFFEMTDQMGETVYYGNDIFAEKPFTDVEEMFDLPQRLREEEIFELPRWAKNKVIYQIFPSRFATDRKVAAETWYKAPITAEDDLQGNLRGIINHLDYLKDLGIDIIYMTPIFQSRSSHKYDTDDYYTIDPSFGSKADLKELVDKAHAMGMYVILDGVFNHTSIDFFAFRDIRTNKEKSPYLDWYYVQELPVRPVCGEMPNYLTFGYYYAMPKLRISNPQVQQYIIDVARYWIRECDIDGWRLDVGDEISHSFWKKFRQAIKAEKPDALIIGEVWHYAPDFLEGDEWDTVMNYPFFNNIHGLLVSDTLTPTQYLENQNRLHAHLNTAVIPYLWNLIGSHDTIRFKTACGNDLAKQKMAAALQLLSPGMPMIYYGDEIGMEGGNDPDCRRGMLWDEIHWDHELHDFYKKLIHLRHTCPAITEGQLIHQEADDATGTITIQRRYQGKTVEIRLGRDGETCSNRLLKDR